MSKDFIKERVGSTSIEKAKKQQQQLSYFTQSEIQDDITQEYIDQWVQRNYPTDDYFMNWVKTIFKTDNFLSFFKFYRTPNASSNLINTRVRDPLRRVFFAEDSYFKYIIRGDEEEQPEELKEDKFQNKLFDRLLFRHNDIIIHDLEDVNKPFRQFLKIEKVVALKSNDNIIEQIAFHAEVYINDVLVKGFAYMDDVSYIFYEKDGKGDYIELANVPHDLGVCPATYVSKEAFADDDIVRKSIFSFVREELESYTFLTTLRRMVDPNGSIPVVTKLKTKETKVQGKDVKGANGHPMSLNELGSQASQEVRKTVQGSNSELQAGTIIEVPATKKDGGGVDVDFAKNFLNFFYLPVESLKYLNERIEALENNLLTAILGYHAEQNEGAKNELQVKQGYVSREDVLRWLSSSMTIARKDSDYKFLSLQYGKDSVVVDIFYGSDFFLESQKELYELFKESPNTIERKNILIRLTRNRNRFNKDRSQREVILYHLMPYISDKDFSTAIDNNAVDPLDFQLQTRFNYWIAQFEANYGDIVVFWNDSEQDDSIKLLEINNLLRGLIQENVNESILNNNEQREETANS